jgi:mono/diheme cytochrome c family protein
MSLCAVVASTVGVWSLAAAAPQDNQSLKPGKSTLDGVFTAVQARRGQTLYESQCSSCHGADLTGFSGPPLTGARFLDRWREFNLNILYDVIKNTMPLNNAGTLTEAGYLQVVSYILKTNGLPSGTGELQVTALAATLLVGKDGPQPLPTSANVEVVGCLTLDSASGWYLTQSTEPVRTLNTFERSAEETLRAKEKPLGDQSFRVPNVAELPGFNADDMMNNKVEIKGILVRQPRNERVNATFIEKIGPLCEPNDR